MKIRYEIIANQSADSEGGDRGPYPDGLAKIEIPDRPLTRSELLELADDFVTIAQLMRPKVH